MADLVVVTHLRFRRNAFSGRRGRLDSPTRTDVDSLMTGAEASSADLLGRPQPDRLDWTCRHWPAAYCAYSRHHRRLLDQIAADSRFRHETWWRVRSARHPPDVRPIDSSGIIQEVAL